MSPIRILPIGSLALSACALLSRGEVARWTWFTPEHPFATAEARVPTRGPAIRFGGVSSGINLGERIAFGDGAYEVNYYDDRRWTDRPTAYVRHALLRTLFETHGFVRDVSGNAPTLDVEIVSFEEIKTPSTHAARIVLHVTLSKERVLFEDTIATEETVTGGRFDDVVAAISHALDTTSGEVASRVGSVFAEAVSQTR